MAYYDRKERGYGSYPVVDERHASMQVDVRATTCLGLTFLLQGLRPAHANGGHVHLGGIFFLLLGGLIFIGGLGTIFYLLFRAEPEDADDMADEEGDDE